MSSNLRGIVRRHQEEYVLRNYLQDQYDTTDESSKRKFLDAVEDSIDREVNNILNVFIDEVQKGSSEKRKRKIRAIMNLVMTFICTPGIAYGVNLENW